MSDKKILDEELEEVSGGYGEVSSYNDIFFAKKTLVKFNSWADNLNGRNGITDGLIKHILPYDNYRIGVEVKPYDGIFNIYPGDVVEYSNDGGSSWIKAKA